MDNQLGTKGLREKERKKERKKETGESVHAENI
jgi:hypothetical protein